MKPIIYSLQFRGQATPLRSKLLRLELAAPSTALVTTVGADGVRSRFEDASGGEAFLESELRENDKSFFAEQGTIEFGRGNTLRFHGIGRHFAACPDPHLSHRAVIRRIKSGKGQFADSTGLITSNFLLSDTGEVTEHHLGVIFVHERSDS